VPRDPVGGSGVAGQASIGVIAFPARIHQPFTSQP